jgi:hypothetical protein
LNVQRAAIQTSGQRLGATISLVKAIGGGWHVGQAMVMPKVAQDPASKTQSEADQGSGPFAKIRRWFQKKP